MTSHKVGTREEWLIERLELLNAEKALTRRGDELAQWRRELPWVRIDKDYRFETDQGLASLADLFRGQSQLLVYHFMFGPDYTAGCLSARAPNTTSANSSPNRLPRRPQTGLWRRGRPPQARTGRRTRGNGPG